MAAATAERLDEHGLTLYEVSNAARPGSECRHNVGYWLGREYLGLGPSAVSAIDGVRWRNVEDAVEYSARVLEKVPAVCYAERLSGAERLLERVMLGLRLRDGFHLAAAEDECGCTLAALAGETLTRAIAEGWLEGDGGWLRLSPVGYPVANRILTELRVTRDNRGGL